MQTALQDRWTIWTNATTEQAARKVAARLLNLLDCHLESLIYAPYPKTGGWTFSFQTPLNGTAHNDTVVEIIALGQRAGYSWILTGDVLNTLDRWSNESRVSGVTNLHWQLWREG